MKCGEECIERVWQGRTSSGLEKCNAMLGTNANLVNFIDGSKISRLDMRTIESRGDFMHVRQIRRNLILKFDDGGDFIMQFCCSCQ